MGRLRVAVCDDLPLVRQSLVSFLSADDAIEVVGSYASGDELLEGLERQPADVLLLDVRMPGLDGHDVAHALSRWGGRPRILYVTSYPDEIPVQDALGGLVAGALSKDLPPADLVRAVHMAASGTTVLSPSMLATYQTPVRSRSRRDTFARDDREREVLRLLFLGLTNDQIASQLHRSSSSVKQILSGMCRRAGVWSRTELVLYLLDEDRA